MGQERAIARFPMPHLLLAQALRPYARVSTGSAQGRHRVSMGHGYLLLAQALRQCVRVGLVRPGLAWDARLRPGLGAVVEQDQP